MQIVPIQQKATKPKIRIMNRIKKFKQTSQKNVYTLPKLEVDRKDLEANAPSAWCGIDRIHGNPARTRNTEPANNTYEKDNRGPMTEIRESHGDGSS